MRSSLCHYRPILGCQRTVSRRLRLSLVATLAVLIACYAGSGTPKIRHATAACAPNITAWNILNPGPNVGIHIFGSCFGNLPYRLPFSGDTPYFVAFDRNSADDWSAGGRDIPSMGIVSDSVTLRYERWTDSEILIGGFSGAYGQNDWYTNCGDQIDVYVWNPQTGIGPASHTFYIACAPSAPPPPPSSPPNNCPGALPTLTLCSFQPPDFTTSVSVDASSYSQGSPVVACYEVDTTPWLSGNANAHVSFAGPGGVMQVDWSLPMNQRRCYTDMNVTWARGSYAVYFTIDDIFGFTFPNQNAAYTSYIVY